MIKGLLHRLDHAASAHMDVERDVEKSIYINVNEYMQNKDFIKTICNNLLNNIMISM